MRDRQAPQPTNDMPGLSPLPCSRSSSSAGIRSHSSSSFSLHAVMMSQAELPAVNKKSLLELKTQMQTERTQSLQPAHTSTKAHDIIPLEGLRISNSAGSVGVVVEEENKHTGTGIDNRGVAAEPSHVFVTPSLDSLPEHAQLTGVSGGINSASGCTTSDMEGSHISRERRAHENTQTFNDREKHIYREAISATHTHRPVSSTAPMRRGNSHDTFSQPKQISKISTRNQVYSSDCLGDHVPVGKSSNAGKRAQSERSVQFKGMKGPMRHKQQHIPHAEHASRSPHTKSGNRYSHTSNRPKTNASTSQNSLRRMQSMEDRTPRHPNPSAHQQQYKLHRQSSPTSEACSSSHSISNTQYERSTSHPPQHHRNSDHNWHRSNDDMRRSRHSDDQFSQRGGTRQSHTRPHTQHTHMQVRASQSAHTHQYYDGPSRAGYWGDKASYSHDQLHSGRPQQSPVVVQQPKHRSPGVPGSGRSSRGARPHSSPTGHSGHAGSKFTQQQPMQENQLQSHSRNHLVPHATSHGALRSDSDVLSPSFHRHPLGYDDSEYVDEEGYTHTQSMPQLYHDGRQNVRTSVNGSSGVVDVSKQKSVNNSPGSPMFQRDGYNNGTIGSDYCSAVINIDYSGEEDLSYEEDSYVSDDQYYLTEREYHESLMGSLRDHMPQPRAYDEYLHNSRTVHVDVGTAGLGISIKGGLEYGLPILVADVMADGPASNILDIGDVILTVNGVIVYMVSHEDAVSVLKQAGNSLTLEVVRDPALRDLIKGSVKPQPEKIKNDFVPTVTEYPWSNDEMPEGWYKGVCPNTDRNYFINPHTKTTTWLDPREEIYLKRHQTLKKQAKGVLPFGWEEVRTDEGEVYYANHIKKVTQWDHPNPKKEPSRKNSWAMLWSPRSSKTSTDETSVKSKSRGSLLSNARGSILSNARGSIFSNARGSVPSNTSLPSRTNSVAV